MTGCVVVLVSLVACLLIAGWPWGLLLWFFVAMICSLAFQ